MIAATQDPSSQRVVPLTGVAVVCREFSDVSAFPDDVVRLIDEFVDPSPTFRLVDVAARAPPGLLRLMQRIARNDAEDLEWLFKHQIFARSLVHAVRHGDLSVVQWLVEEYEPCAKIRQALNEAVTCGQLEILAWLAENHESRLVWNGRELQRAARGNHLWMTIGLFECSRQFDGDDANNLSKVLLHSAANGNLDMAKWVAEQCRLRDVRLDPVDALVVSATNGHRGLTEYIWEQFDGSFTQRHFDSAIGGGNLEIVKWLHARRGYSWANMHYLSKAAKTGNTALAEWVLDNIKLKYYGFGWLIGDVATAGHLDLVKLFYKHLEGSCSTRVMDNSATNGHLEVVKWLHANLSEGCTFRALDGAATNGHLEVVKWLHANRSEGCTFRALDGAATNGHLEVVKWLHANRSEGCTFRALDGAATNGHLEIVKWLHTNRSEGGSPNAMIWAAANGHLDVLQWLHANRHDGSSFVAMDEAAKHGHLEIVKWLHQNRHEGCSKQAMMNAAMNGHLLVVKWLHENRSEGCTSGILSNAAANGHLHVVKWLCANQLARSWSSGIHGAARGGYFEVVKWLLAHNQGNKLGPGALIAAVDGGNFEIVLAIDQVVRPFVQPSVKLFRRACRESHVEILLWLIREYGDRTPGLEDNLRRRMRSNQFDPYIRDIVQDLLSLRDAP